MIVKTFMFDRAKLQFKPFGLINLKNNMNNEFVVVIYRTKENAVVCVTTKSDSRKNGIIEMTFDRARTTYTGRYFKYVADPTITKVEPQKSILR